MLNSTYVLKLHIPAQKSNEPVAKNICILQLESINLQTPAKRQNIMHAETRQYIEAKNNQTKNQIDIHKEEQTGQLGRMTNQ